MWKRGFNMRNVKAIHSAAIYHRRTLWKTTFFLFLIKSGPKTLALTAAKTRDQISCWQRTVPSFRQRRFFFVFFFQNGGSFTIKLFKPQQARLLEAVRCPHNLVLVALYQWRIQDFPMEGQQPLWGGGGGANLLFIKNMQTLSHNIIIVPVSISRYNLHDLNT